MNQVKEHHGEVPSCPTLDLLRGAAIKLAEGVPVVDVRTELLLSGVHESEIDALMKEARRLAKDEPIVETNRKVRRSKATMMFVSGAVMIVCGTATMLCALAAGSALPGSVELLKPISEVGGFGLGLGLVLVLGSIPTLLSRHSHHDV